MYLEPMMMFNFRLDKVYSKLRVKHNLDLLLLHELNNKTWVTYVLSLNKTFMPHMLANLVLGWIALYLHEFFVALVLRNSRDPRIMSRVMFNFILHKVYNKKQVMNSLVVFVLHELNKVLVTNALCLNKLLRIFIFLRLKLYHKIKGKFLVNLGNCRWRMS